MRLLEPARARFGGGAVIARRLLEPLCVRASRLPMTDRRASGISGEKVRVSSDDSRERERISAPSSLPRLSADIVLLRGRPWFGWGYAVPYSVHVIPKLPVASPGSMAVADGVCNVLGTIPAAEGGRAAVTEGPAALP